MKVIFSLTRNNDGVCVGVDEIVETAADERFTFDLARSMARIAQVALHNSKRALMSDDYDDDNRKLAGRILAHIDVALTALGELPGMSSEDADPTDAVAVEIIRAN